jgi:23S rRNA (cytosine1962-C5)-methyltransferase
MMKLISPANWKEYELIDSGGQEKLERFGEFILARPEPQAVWAKSMPEAEWERMLHARYRRTRGVDPGKGENPEKGEWMRKKQMPDQWQIGFRHGDMHLRFRLGLTAFGHIGLFPEQASNWNYIYDVITSSPPHHLTTSPLHHLTTAPPHSLTPSPPHTLIPFRVLNLFAYTGGASLAARAAGADVVHVDSVKPVVSWAREMMEASGLKDIRWVVEDALKFIRREAKRGNRYDGIILDPPAYGRGPEGEKWILQDSVDEVIGLCRSLMPDGKGLFILSLYSMGFSALIGENLVRSHFGDIPSMEKGELFIPDRAGRKLPLGTFLRFNNL